MFTFVTILLKINKKNTSRFFTLAIFKEKGFILNPVRSNNANYISRAVTAMTKADAMKPIVALEATVVSGRTYQAYKRGKWDEARERFIEETMGSIVWLCGVKYLNKLGDLIIDKAIKGKGKSFDVGTDKVLRTPFENFMKNVAPKGFTEKQVALMKGAKVLSSILIANYVIGFVVPKINHTLTKKLRHERQHPQEQNNNNNNNNNNNVAFKGGRGFEAINLFTHAIENTNTGQLLSTDFGVAGGRMYNARRKEERREVAIRDIGSIYFYMWAQGHVRNLLNLAETGHATRLNPETASAFTEHLSKYLDKAGNELSVEDFKKGVLGNSDVKLKDNLPFESQKQSSFAKFMKKEPLEVIKLSDVEKHYGENAEIIDRARRMSKIQPERVGVPVLTKQQLIDSINAAEINDPEFLDKAFSQFTEGASKDEYKFVSNKKIYKLKKEMEQYVDTICKASKDGKVDKKLLDKVLKKNITYSGLNFAAGFAVAAAFLSTLIPKFQYWYTRKTTGMDEFPGVYDFEHHHEEID